MNQRMYISPSRIDELLASTRLNLNVCQEQILGLLNNEAAEIIAKIRSDEILALLNHSDDLYLHLESLDCYFATIITYLDQLEMLSEILQDQEKTGAINANNPLYTCAAAVYQNILNSTVELLSRKELNPQNMYALHLLNQTVNATINICWALDPVDESSRMRLVINDLKKSSNRILCPDARRAVIQGLVHLSVLTMILVPAAVLFAAPLLCVFYVIPLAVAAIYWSDKAKAGQKFWNPDRDNFKPLIGSMNTLFKCSSEEPPSTLAETPSNLTLLAS